MKKIFFLSFVAVLFFSSYALAEGPYIGGGLVYNDPVGSDFKDLNPGLGLDFRFGYDFGSVALEGDLMGSGHSDTDPTYGNADFSGFSVDLKIFLSPPQVYDPNQIYLLVGIGSYSIDQFVQGSGNVEWDGGGWNFGAGLEHYLNPNLALDFGVIYRIIRYDEQVDSFGSYPIPYLNGDTLSFRAGVTYHF